MAGNAVRVTDEGGVRRLTFCRPDAYNTITPELRDELGDASNQLEMIPLAPR